MIQTRFRQWNIVDLFDYCLARNNPLIEVVNDDNTTSEVGEFRDLTFLWLSGKKNYEEYTTDDYILCSESFVNLIRSKFFDFSFLTSFYYDVETNKRVYVDNIHDASIELIKAITTWKNNKLPAFEKLLNALRTNYDPISNYDKHSTITTEYAGSEKTEFTPTGTESDTTAYSGTESDTLSRSGEENNTFKKGVEKRDHYKTTYESTTPYLTDSDELTGTNGVAYSDTNKLTFTNRQDTNTKSFTNRQDTNTHSFTNRKDTSERTFDDRIDTVTEHTSGNIGITTSQQMLLSQFGITDADDIEYYVVCDFARSCLIH